MVDRVKGLAPVKDPDNSHKQASVAAAEVLIKAETLVVAAGAEAGEAVETGRTDKCIMWALVRVLASLSTTGWDTRRRFSFYVGLASVYTQTVP